MSNHVRQSRLGSLLEAFINILIGFGINFAANMLILPFFGFHITVSENLVLGLIYTGISVARSYAVRRWFDARIHKLAQSLGGGSSI